MIGVEFDMVVKDALAALALYERIFDVERLEVTNYPIGSNDAIFNMYGGRFHLFDENPEYMMLAPKEGDPKPLWPSIALENIREVYAKAMEAGCTEIQPPTEIKEFGVINATFVDPFGHIWALIQIDRIISFEERDMIFKEKMGI